MIKRLFNFLNPVLQPLAKLYFNKPRSFHYLGIKGVVLPDVFHPQLTISTKLLMEFIDKLELKGKSLLELGCGTGFISTLAAKKGAKVLASDINPKAIENTMLNVKKNEVNVEVLLSDLFEKTPNQLFDFIIINPPYYPKNPKSIAENAWYCGADFEYFKRLFPQLLTYQNDYSKIYMILSEDCELQIIKDLAAIHRFDFELVLETKRQGEWNYIFRIQQPAKSKAI